jgi:hypothetical protein
MIQEKRHEQLSEFRRKDIFFALVNAQDRQRTVDWSRSFIARFFKVNESSVRRIEVEGIANQWPPLCQ